MDRLDVAHFKAWEPFPLENQPKEFQPIVRKVNELIVRIQNGFLKFHQLGQFVAHEVRTPLTVIQGEIENALESPGLRPEEYGDTLASCLDEVSRIEEIVATVLRISVQDGAVRPYAPETIDLDSFLRELLPKYERYTGRTFVLAPAGIQDPSIFADRELLTLLLGNLLRNVARHTPLPTQAEVRVFPQGSSEIAIEIADRGPGLSADLLQAVNSDQMGSELLGIGLSLCKQIANVSHLKLEFANRPEGGLTARISCPKAPSGE
jgi:signal transduction histidine kinase